MMSVCACVQTRFYQNWLKDFSGLLHEGDQGNKNDRGRFFGKFFVLTKFGDLGPKWTKIGFLVFCGKLS